MSEIKLVAQPRTAFGKGAARRVRRSGNVPAVMYGHGTAPIHITLPAHDTMMALKVANALLSIELDGQAQLALAKDVQRDPVRPVIEHIDLVVVRRDEKVTVDVQVHTVGEPAPDTLVNVENQTVELEVLATAIPEAITVSVEGMTAPHQIHARDLTLPEGAALVTDGDILVVNITGAISEEALEAELAEAEAEAGIEHDAPESDAAGDTDGGATADSEGSADEPAGTA